MSHDSRGGSRLSPAAWLTLARPTPRTIAAQPPHDCVRQFPVVGENAAHLVGFDLDGKARIEIKLPADEPLSTWEAWILRWMRRKYGRRSSIAIVK